MYWDLMPVEIKPNTQINSGDWVSGWLDRTSDVFGYGGYTYAGLEQMITPKGFWLDAKGNYKFTNLLVRQANGKYVQGVQGYRNGYASALRASKVFKWGGWVTTGISGGIEIGIGVHEDGGAYGYNAQKATASAAGGALGGWAGAALGAKVGALVGTAIFPGVGTAIGAAVFAIGGGIAGSIGGSAAGNTSFDLIY
jgi:hypothetical protein